ncbi:ATP-grasp domain-containing protein [Streptomyces sp. NBC_01343]|uniref:ATP-grasp domain-containing protein n=1 Tax=Streptomyces sp. NBC_01343 TaxID=2903832 RepID=UPI002E11B356|nr:ATP-grasp domain-containing protein [Streptomyces sp. NBC_01343]
MDDRATPTLLLNPPRTTTAELLAQAAAWRGHDVTAHVGQAEGRETYWYGGPLAADLLSDRLGLGLLDPADDWLATVPHPLLRRSVRLTTLAEARSLREPAFVKPPSAKIDLLPAAVYEEGSALPAALADTTPVLVSEVVEFAAEYRLFVLDGEAAAGSRYAVYGRPDPAPLDAHARAFAREVLEATADGLPSAVCVDVGRLTDGGWAIVEANMPWFAHCYAAEPDAVLDVVLRAAGPRTRLADRDLPFLRAPEGGPREPAAR